MQLIVSKVKRAISTKVRLFLPPKNSVHNMAGKSEINACEVNLTQKFQVLFPRLFRLLPGPTLWSSPDAFYHVDSLRAIQSLTWFISYSLSVTLYIFSLLLSVQAHVEPAWLSLSILSLLLRAKQRLRVAHNWGKASRGIMNKYKIHVALRF